METCRGRLNLPRRPPLLRTPEGRVLRAVAATILAALAAAMLVAVLLAALGAAAAAAVEDALEAKSGRGALNGFRRLPGAAELEAGRTGRLLRRMACTRSQHSYHEFCTLKHSSFSSHH